MLKDGDYKQKIESFYGASVGQHIRHSVNHFETLLSASKQSWGYDTEKVFNYDNRSRDTLLESDRETALRTIDGLASALPKLHLDSFVNIGFVASGKDESFQEYAMRSTVERELAFVTHHSIHHLSTIHLMMKHLNYPEVDSTIGKAPSTMRFDAQKK